MQDSNYLSNYILEQAASIIQVHKNILKITEGDKQCNSFWIADGYHVTVKDDRIFMFDFSESLQPFADVGDDNYTTGLINENIFSRFLTLVFIKFTAIYIERKNNPPSKSKVLDWNLSPQTLVAMDHLYKHFTHIIWSYKDFSPAITAIAKLFDGEHFDELLFFTDPVKGLVLYSKLPVEFEDGPHHFEISYDGKQLAPIHKRWEKFMIDHDSLYNKYMAYLPNCPQFQKNTDTPLTISPTLPVN